MGIFDSLRPAPRPHPEFGTVEYAHGHWHGSIALDEARMPLHLPGSRSGPDPEGLETATQAPAWWAVVKSAVASELFDHYTAGFEGGIEALPGLAAAGDVWTRVEISSVQVKPHRSSKEIQVAIRAAWDEEHTLGALIREGELVELNGSILEPR